MKKLIACILTLTALSLLLCGCGAGMDGSSAVVETPVLPMPSVTVSPMPTPDAEDGLVTDRDGFIEGRETEDHTQPGHVQPSPAVTKSGSQTEQST